MEFPVRPAAAVTGASRPFREKPGGRRIRGDSAKCRVIIPNEPSNIGPFQGTIEMTRLRLNSGRDWRLRTLAGFGIGHEVRRMRACRWHALTCSADESALGPGRLWLRDPDGNPILFGPFAPGFADSPARVCRSAVLGVRVRRGRWRDGCDACEAEEEASGAADGLAGAAALLVLAGGVGADGDVGFLVDVVVEADDDGADDGGEEARRDLAGAAEDGGLDGVELAADVGAGHPEGECRDGGAVVLGDVAERDVGIAQVGDDELGLIRRGRERVEHDPTPPRVRIGCVAWIPLVFPWCVPRMRVAC
ncbi:MAG: hypothetical protein JNM07_01110 [Phycisphaerae bacterium]|nr:hypothetical protein [Phycisphaerae bacterium]